MFPSIAHKSGKRGPQDLHRLLPKKFKILSGPTQAIPCTPHKSPLLETGTTKIDWVTSKKFSKFVLGRKGKHTAKSCFRYYYCPWPPSTLLFKNTLIQQEYCIPRTRFAYQITPFAYHIQKPTYLVNVKIRQTYCDFWFGVYLQAKDTTHIQHTPQGIPSIPCRVLLMSFF